MTPGGDAFLEVRRAPAPDAPPKTGGRFAGSFAASQVSKTTEGFTPTCWTTGGRGSCATAVALRSCHGTEVEDDVAQLVGGWSDCRRGIPPWAPIVRQGR
jgi:hypothetical protein